MAFESTDRRNHNRPENHLDTWDLHGDNAEAPLRQLMRWAAPLKPSPVKEPATLLPGGVDRIRATEPQLPPQALLDALKEGLNKTFKKYPSNYHVVLLSPPGDEFIVPVEGDIFVLRTDDSPGALERGLPTIGGKSIGPPGTMMHIRNSAPTLMTGGNVILLLLVQLQD